MLSKVRKAKDFLKMEHGQRDSVQAGSFQGNAIYKLLVFLITIRIYLPKLGEERDDDRRSYKSCS
jgi:hypothetical protein